LFKTDCECELTDAELVGRTRLGSLEAYDVLVTRYRRGIYRLALGMTQNHEASDDLAQEAFILAFKRIRQLKNADRFGPWLRKILTNLCIRHASRQRPSSLEGEISDESSDSAEKDLVRQSVRSAIFELEPNERATVLLYYMEGLTQADIADVLDCPIGTILSRLSSARAKLRDRLADLIG
jgi:RNA polymerase sigma-70 factor (ECF subfamily)